MTELTVENHGLPSPATVPLEEPTSGVGDFGLTAARERRASSGFTVFGKERKRTSTSLVRPLKDVKIQRSILHWLDSNDGTDYFQRVVSQTQSSQDEAPTVAAVQSLDEDKKEEEEGSPVTALIIPQTPSVEDYRKAMNRSVFGYRTVYTHARNAINVDAKAKGQQRQQQKASILVQLVRRSASSRPLRCLSSTNEWAQSDTVCLGSEQHTYTMGTATFTHVQFDSQGILLATADSKGLIRIYDFDEVQYQDSFIQRRRNGESNSNNTAQETRRTSTTPKTPILPTMEFKSLSRISCLKWNPYNQDELALSFIASAELRLYDLSSFDDTSNCPHFIRIVPAQTISKGQSISFFQFLPTAFTSLGTPSNHSVDCFDNASSSSSSPTWFVTGGSRGLLILWRLLPTDPTKNQSRRANLVWSIQIWKQMGQAGLSSEGISDIVLLNHPGLVLVAGDRGSMAILDISRCTHKAFSTQVTPELIQSWHLPSSFKSLRPCAESSSYSEMMGIRKVYTDFEYTDAWKLLSKRQGHGLQQTQLTYHCSLITFGGWVITMNMQWMKQGQSFNKISISDLEVIHKSRNTRVALSTEDPGCIIPDFPSPAMLISSSSTHMICVAYVKPTISFFADETNARVLVSSHHSRHDMTEKDALLFIQCSGKKIDSVQDNVTFKIQLPAFPVTMDIHPNNSWIVVGVTDKNSNESNLLLLRHYR